MTSLCLPLLLLAAPVPPHAATGLEAPPGFEVTEFAGSDLANDIYTLTIDPRGRVVVAGLGYIRILLDADHDGRADRALPFASAPKDGAMGLLWEGATLYCTGDGGLLSFCDLDSDDRADGPPARLLTLGTGGEHKAHALRRGPDGWMYVLCGDGTGVSRAHVRSERSPLPEPVGGCVLRLAPNGKTCEVVADGFRNAYDMDFNADGELFTYDSDNERCVSLPWYEPTRFYHVVPGGNHGWRGPKRGSWWRQPPYSFDVTPPAVTLGRGSPTACVCYRHGQFPPKYRGGFFLCDWTFGRIYFVTLKRDGSTYTATREVFLRSTGDNGFAPTGAVVHPATGDLYVSIGGRGTRGAVYRIRYPAGMKTATREAARWKLAARPLNWQPDWTDELPRRALGEDVLERRRALELIRRHGERFDVDAVLRVVRGNAGQPDRLLRQAAARLLATLDGKQIAALANECKTGLEKTTVGLAAVWAGHDPGPAARLFTDPVESAEVRLAALRLVQRSMGDLTNPKYRGMVWEGYSAPDERTEPVALRLQRELAGAFPSGHADLDRELTRTMALTADPRPATLEKVAARLTLESGPTEDLHHLIVLSRLHARRTELVTARVAAALLGLDAKVTARGLNRESNWPLRLAELHRELVVKDPELNAALLAHPEFGRPDHALWTQAPGFDRARAARAFLARAKKDPAFAWNAGLVDLVGELPNGQSMPVLRGLWDKAGLDDAVLAVLARRPEGADRDKFVRALESPQLATVRLSLLALEKLPPKNDAETATALVLALARLPDGKEEERTRTALARYLQKVTGETGPGAERDAWVEWLNKAHPAQAARLADADGVDVAAWSKRLARVDWDKGDPQRGKEMYVRASCAACHSGAQALGPDLAGVAGRFSRADVFTAIVRPSKDVSARYRTTLVVTRDDKVYQGVIVYEAVDSVLLQTGPATTARIADSQVAQKRVTPRSLMPAGLLDRLADRDLADLYAYLKGLRSP